MTTALIDEFITQTQQMRWLAVCLGYANFVQMMTDALQTLHDETLGQTRTP